MRRGLRWMLGATLASLVVACGGSASPNASNNSPPGTFTNGAITDPPASPSANDAGASAGSSSSGTASGESSGTQTGATSPDGGMSICASCDAAASACRNHALGKPYVMTAQPDAQYADRWNARLTDGDEGGDWPLDPWLGWNSPGDVTVTVDLQFAHELRSLDLLLQSRPSYAIHYPTSASASVSDDGINFRSFGTFTVPTDASDPNAVSVDWAAALGCDTARYVRVRLSGCTNWCFASEIHALGPATPRAALLERSDGRYFGGFMETAQSTVDLAGFQGLSKKVPSTMLWYSGWPEPYATNPGPIVDSLAARNIVLQLGWEPNGKKLTDILDGSFDPFLHTWFQSAHASGKPIFVRMMSEMNTTWTDWSGSSNGGEAGDGPGQYRAAWWHIVNIARAESAANVAFVWSPTTTDFPTDAWNASANYYPGADYVDWVGMSLYDYNGAHPRAQVTPLYDVYAGDHPVMISEGSAHPSIRAAWTKELFAVATELPRLKAITWFNEDDDVGMWSFVDPSAALTAWQKGVASSDFIAGTP